MTTREEAAAKAINASHKFGAIFLPWSTLVKSADKANRNRVKIDRDLAQTALAAADAHDAAHNIHRVSLDDATVERASEALLGGYEWCECRRSPFDKHDVNPPCSTRVQAREAARAVLAAAVEAGQ